ncbi:hypothetical protein J4573_04210 [Actinomadura barringtoniae]|uniref:Regulatory protein n=1 Tax=Actinomadura barringtoniae TaxID=1427535 RepID=A0A939P6N5_9ACTN|nr:DUF5685 family protein [Actinomadura barringtoniae]MBO2446280.1 hypothetical protein [Actinomadura barringtoniae]
MFGVVRPCRHVLCGSLFEDWLAHLCGLCLTLRAEHGHAARLVTNYDGLLVSVLVEAQSPELSPRRKAGPCALRGMKPAQVVDARAQGAQLAAAASLLLAAGKTRDHVSDGDGPYGRRLVAAAAGRMAERWDSAGSRTGAKVGFDPRVLRDAVARQPELEAAGGLGLLELTEPAETAVAAVFAHTAVLAAKEQNAEALAEAGRFFGRLAHLIDAVEDLAEDREAGAYNPLLATGTSPAEARRHCDDALHGLRLAVADLDLENRRLVRALLGREVRRSVDTVFAAYPGGPPPQGPYGPQGQQGPYGPPPQGGGEWVMSSGKDGGFGGHGGHGGHGGGGGFGGHGGNGRRGRPGFPIPCIAGACVCASCGVYQPDWSEHAGKGCSDRCWCTRACDNGCDGSCCDSSCCDCCNCCENCDCCDCGCDC